jgi:hypothetical protein
MRAEREGLVDAHDFGFGQLEVSSPGVFGDVVGVGGFWDCEESGLSHQKPKRDLAWSNTVRGGNLGEDLPTFDARSWKTVVTEWTVTHYCDTVLLTPGNDRVLDGALFQMVKHLIASDSAVACYSPCLFEIGHVEVAQAPGKDFPIALELLEGSERFGQRMLAPPVQ